VVVVLLRTADSVVGSTRVVVLGTGRAETCDPPPESFPEARITIAATPSATTSADAASRRCSITRRCTAPILAERGSRRVAIRSDPGRYSTASRPPYTASAYSTKNAIAT